MRADIWRRYGALGNVGMSAMDICREIAAGGASTRGMTRETFIDVSGKTRKVSAKGTGLYDALFIDGTIRNETTKDIVNDILTYKAAAKLKVKQAIFRRTQDADEQKRLFTALKGDAWLADPFLHRQMRKHFKHGTSAVANPFIVRSDKYTTEVINGKRVIRIKVANTYGGDITLTTTTSGKNVTLTGCNLRIIVKEAHTEIHYATDKAEGRACGDQVLGIDKGYTESFTDSDGEHHGIGFGRVMTEYSDQVAATGKQRNKLHALEKKHRANGNIAKAGRIRKNNLGRTKLTARKERAQKRLRNIADQAAHSIVDKAGMVVSEDLTSPIAKKFQWKRFNRRMSAWAKGVLAESLDSICAQRKAEHRLVNGAYTSQMDSTTRLLEGKRDGDKFYRVNGEVLQADHNAALNVLARIDDAEITRFTPYLEVRRILLSRSPAQLSVNRLELAAMPFNQVRINPTAQLWAGI